MRNSSVIVLAGGTASRLGTPKTLVKHTSYQGPWLEEQIRNILEVGLRHIIVVLGNHADREKHELPNNLPCEFQINPAPERGPFSSLLVGVRAISGISTFVLPIDVPAPTRLVWESLHQGMQNGIKACVPVVLGVSGTQERSGHPVLLSLGFCQQLLKWHSPTSRLDHLLKSLPQCELAKIPVEDSKAILNLNTREDWEHYLTEYRSAIFY